MDQHIPWYYDLPTALLYLNNEHACLITLSDIVHVAHIRTDISDGGTIRSMIGVLRTENQSIGFWYGQYTTQGLEQEGGWKILKERLLPAEVTKELSEKESIFIFGRPPEGVLSSGIDPGKRRRGQW